MAAHRNTTPTTDQLRHAIDRGAAGDKVDWPDPAASPLGTDAEAGGAVPKPSEIAQAAAHEVTGKSGSDQRPGTGLAVAGFVLVVVLAAVISLLVI